MEKFLTAYYCPKGGNKHDSLNMFWPKSAIQPVSSEDGHRYQRVLACFGTAKLQHHLAKKYSLQIVMQGPCMQQIRPYFDHNSTHSSSIEDVLNDPEKLTTKEVTTGLSSIDGRWLADAEFHDVAHDGGLGPAQSRTTARANGRFYPQALKYDYDQHVEVP